MNKNRFSQIKKIKKYSHKKKKFSYANRGLNRWVDWVHVSSIATFYMQGPGDQSICLSGQRILASYLICRENIKYSELKRQTDHGQAELSNMLVKKNVLNEINKEGIFTQGFKECRKIKRKVCKNLDDLPNLLIKLTVKASSEKAWPLYEFPFSLNPGEKPNDAQA